MRGNVTLETTDTVLQADEIDYNQQTGDAEARGNVRYENLNTGEKVQCDRAEYNLETEEGKFFNVRGTSPAKIDARPGLLTTQNPFYFEGAWAERLRGHYILHQGMVTDCKIPRPAWTLRGPKFDILPGERALAYRSIYRLKGIPLFYAPAFYKSLKKAPRRSGFLTPNIGNSNRRGFMLGAGYYWAINRSYDVMYRAQLFTTRGFAHTFDLRGKPTQRSDFNVNIYGVNDRGLRQGDTVRNQGGYVIASNGRIDLGRGWEGRASINYLSGLEFRQAFTESFTEAIFSETHSTAFLSRHWSTFAAYVVYSRDENFQTILPGDKVLLRKLPQVQFLSRDRKLFRKGPPVYVSLDSTFGFLHRDQPQFQTRQYVDRLDVAPRVSTAFHWKGIHLVPAFSVRGTHYGSSFQDGKVTGAGLWRQSRETTVELYLPSLEKIMKAPKWIGEKMKHVIETRAVFRHVDGVQDFDKIVRFDVTELLTNTTELEVSVANRLYGKRKDGSVQEVVSWQVWQRRYFDPTFGGAVVTGRRNVLASTVDVTAFAFLDGPRNYSPMVSALRFQPTRFGIEWRTDYDPLRGQVVNSTFTADGRWSRYFVSAGHNQVRSAPDLTPNSNQFRFSFGVGNENRKGWNAATLAFYDYRIKKLQFSSTQVTYNWDCCGFSLQFRRFDFGPRQENQFRVSFAIANIGSFGTIRRLERVFF